jgi:hypothetical protein
MINSRKEQRTQKRKRQLPFFPEVNFVLLRFLLLGEGFGALLFLPRLLNIINLRDKIVGQGLKAKKEEL